MKKIAALIKNFNNSQLSFFMLNSFNKLSEENLVAPYIFYSDLSKPTISTMFSIMNMYYANHYNGVLITTSLNTTKLALDLNTKSSKFFYMWDLEWLRDKLNYLENLSIINKVQIIARSVEHSVAIEKYCGKKPVYIMEDWDTKILLELK